MGKITIDDIEEVASDIKSDIENDSYDSMEDVVDAFATAMKELLED
jgi:hypothetical protein